MSETGASAPDKERRRGASPWLWTALAALVGAIALAGGLVLSGGSESQISGFEAIDRRVLLPRLGERLDAVRIVEIEGANGAAVFEKTKAGWRLASHDGYPVHAQPVEALIADMAALEATHVQADGPAPLGDYGVAERGAGFGEGTALTMFDRDRQPIAGLVIGNAFTGAFAHDDVNARQTFVRRSGDARVWVVDGEPPLPGDPLAWSGRTVVDVPRQSVVEMVATAPDGAQIAVRRDGDGRLDLREGLAPGDTPAGEFALDWLASALEKLKFDDVRRADAIRWRSADTWRLTATTQGGVTYQVRATNDADAHWATVSAGVAGAADDADAARRARRFNEQHAGWAYRVSPYAFERLAVTAADLPR